ncbi:MAG: hypothetical protein P1P88_11350, partial [Bacteroidales bacterium]|nr:hypothetical protein [Bacteroidales bacterium]
MKNRKLQIALITSTFIFLLLLLFIQINNLIDTAETEKRHFTQSVKLSLDLAAAQISQDRQMCRNVQSCLLDTQSIASRNLKKLEWNKVDSIIKSNLEQYAIDLAYDFEIVYAKAQPFSIYDTRPEICYSESLDIALQQGGVELR